MLAVIELSFDPALHVGDLLLRWQTVGLTIALLAGFAVAAAIDAGAARAARSSDALRPADLAYIVLGSVPGAVVGGRLVHAIVFWQAYAADPISLLDVSTGSLSLTGALLGGTVSAFYVAHLLRAPTWRWADAAVVPLLLTLGLGKLAQLLGGSGQGVPFDGPWAVAFGGAGPWVSALPDVPAHPAQVYEGLWLLAGIPLALMWAARRGVGGSLREQLSADHGSGRLFAGLLLWFMLGRLLVGFTWRDDKLFGPLNVEQAIALACLLGVGIGLLLRGRDNVATQPTTPREGNR
jgi:prolipoprotein diacylglyceryltransferase